MFFSPTAHKEIGALIKTARTAAGLAQAELATKLGYSSPQFISNWERAESLPPIHTLPKIAKFTKADYGAFKTILKRDFDRILEKPVARA